MSFTSVHHRSWLSEQDCDLDAFRALVEQATDPADYPHASAVERNVLVYDCGLLEGDRVVQAELVRALADGPASWSSAAPFPTPGSWTGPPTCSRR